jgi:hypothetical protein
LDAISTIRKIQTRKKAFFFGRAPRSIVCGLFYLLGFRYDVEKKQREIAKTLGTNEVTIRTSYRELLNAFPDLFLDIIGKFAQHKDLKYFILLDLDQKKAQSIV